MNKCATCGIGFYVYADYQDHLNNHKGDKMNKMAPTNTSGRTKTQIVWDAEHDWLKPILIDGLSSPTHSIDCKCMACFDRFYKAQNDGSNDLS